MFIGRSDELKSLTEYYNSGRYECAIIYGRRRVGKTELITEFVKDKKHIFFTAVEGTYQKNLAILSKSVFNGLNGGVRGSSPSFSDFSDCLDHIYHNASEKLVVVFDEYPYFARSEKSVSSILQQYIDHKFQKADIMFILCGSSMSFMENQVLGYKSPLYGRRTAQYKVLPFDYYECAEMLSGFSSEDRIILYGITGGIPEYVSRIDSSLSVRENARDLFFDPSGRLFEEPSNLLKQELKIPQTYNGIITAIATGSSRLNEIATKTDIETSQCSNMLNTLISLGLVKKESPIINQSPSQSSRKTIYVLEDHMFRFWYRFVLPDISRITAGLGGTVCSEVFGGRIDAYTGYVFEECAKQYMWRALARGALPVSFQKIGRWWGNNPHEKREEEIDFIAYSGTQAIFGECKWRNEKPDEDVLDDLIRKSSLHPQLTERYYALFSKSGFTDSLTKWAESTGNVLLVELGAMMSIS